MGVFLFCCVFLPDRVLLSPSTGRSKTHGTSLRAILETTWWRVGVDWLGHQCEKHERCETSEDVKENESSEPTATLYMYDSPFLLFRLEVVGLISARGGSWE